MPAPSAVNIPNIDNISVKAAPLPADIPGNGTITVYRILVIGLTLGAFTAYPNAWFLIALAAWAGWAGASSAGSSERQAERTKRRAAMDLARAEFEAIVARVKKEAGPEGFHAQKDALRKLRDEFQALPVEERKELDKLHATAHARQKQKFLERLFIDNADIPGVGAARKSTLRSFGIETAADVDRHRILQVKGFGESLTRSITDWKASCERRFVFNPANAVSEADKNMVKAQFGARKSALAASLGEGATGLQRFCQTATARASSLQPLLDQAAKKFAQAKSDLALL